LHPDVAARAGGESWRHPSIRLNRESHRAPARAGRARERNVEVREESGKRMERMREWPDFGMAEKDISV
jgi:hypothetical protein